MIVVMYCLDENQMRMQQPVSYSNIFSVIVVHVWRRGKRVRLFIKHLLFIYRVMATCKKSFDVLVSTLFSLFSPVPGE